MPLQLNIPVVLTHVIEKLCIKIIKNWHHLGAERHQSCSLRKETTVIKQINHVRMCR